MITAARPTTIVPVPIVMSAKPLVCANSAPASATSALLSAMPTQIARAGRDALGARHARIGAGRAHGEPELAGEEPGQQRHAQRPR